jgi:predicted nucleotidyltransferase
MNPDLLALARILADWIEPAPNLPAVYLYGSRVRGDHHPNSDVDVRVLPNEWRDLQEVDVEWWTNENATDFAALRARLPGPLHLPLDPWNAADAAIREGRKNPVLVLGRVVCVWTRPQKR